MTEDTSQGCIFCKIALGELPANLAYEDSELMAFEDLNPQAPTHTLLIPRRHIASVDGLADEDAALVGRLILTARDLARAKGISDPGYRLVTNVGADGGQSVGHLHVHLLGGRPLSWPPG